MKALFLTVFIVLSFQVHGHETMYLKGYSSCVACHYSTKGGSPLNDYGKLISSQKSLRGSKGKIQSKLKDILSLNGKIDHSIQARLAHLKTELSNEVFPMQFDYSTVVKLGKTNVVSSIARAPKRKGRKSQEDTSQLDNFYFRELKAVHQLNQKHYFTLGRERQNFGLNLEDHSLFNKGLNRLNVTDLTTIFKHDFINKNYSISSSLFFPSFQDKEGNGEKGVKYEFKKDFGYLLIGTGLLVGKSDLIARGALNLYFKAKFFNKFILMSEGYFTRRKTSQSVYFSQLTSMTRIHYFLGEFIDLNILGEYSQRQEPFKSRQKRIGVGAYFKLSDWFSLRVDGKRTFK